MVDSVQKLLWGFPKKNEDLQFAIVCTMFVLGLNLPNSFSLAGLILVVGFFFCRREIGLVACNALIKFLAICLFLFGISFSLRQLQLGYWILDLKSLSDLLTISIFPSACLVLGYIARLRFIGRAAVSAAVVSFSLGGLVYVLMALCVSRDPWWSLAEIFPSSVSVPWGSHGQLIENVRSVEQRAFPALSMLACVPLLFTQRKRNWLSLSLLFLFSGGLAYHLLWSLNGRLRYVALVASFLPYLFAISNKLYRSFVALVILIVVSLGVRFRFLCDERLPLQLAFLSHIKEFPWGGRQISFGFKGCQGEDMFFAKPPNSLHLPHNIFLDVVNDVGVIPAFFLCIASSVIVLVLARGFFRDFIFEAWDIHDSLRFGLFAALICQSLWQPLLYSDRFLFTVSFLLTGAVVAEFEKFALRSCSCLGKSHNQCAQCNAD